MHYYEDGKPELSFVYRPEFPVLTEADQAAIAANWQIIAAAKPNSFIGQNFSCNGIITESPDSVVLGINKIDYATYVYHRSHGLNNPGAYNAGDNTLLYIPPEDSYFFTIRSQDVGCGEGKYSASSGGSVSVPDVPVPAADFLSFVAAHAQEETEEELETIGLQPAMLLQTYLDEACKLEFFFLAQADAARINNWENTGSQLVPRGGIEEFVHRHTGNMEETTLNHLLVLASLLDGPPLT